MDKSLIGMNDAYKFKVTISHFGNLQQQQQQK